MRGHAQMIPFGLSKNIISIISHDKIGYFLEDVMMTEYGIDVNEVNFLNKAKEIFSKVISNNIMQIKHIDSQKRIIFSKTKNNIEMIFKND